jgi:hypothetical protein
MCLYVMSTNTDTTTEETESKYTETGQRKLAQADAMDELAGRVRQADSIADEVPELAELFHNARTSSRKSRQGRFIALLDYDFDAEEWSCRNVSFLQQGTHYRDTGAEASVSQKPFPFLSVEEFGRQVAASLERNAKATRQNAYNYRKDSL